MTPVMLSPRRPGNQHQIVVLLFFVGITETWGDLLLLFFFDWLGGVFAIDLPDVCVLHDVHFYLLGVHSPPLKTVTGPPGGFTNVPRRQWRGGHVEQGANTGCR